jgi:hypothetical protein
MQRIPHPPEAGFALERVFFGHEIPLPESIEDAKYRSEKGKKERPMTNQSETFLTTQTQRRGENLEKKSSPGFSPRLCVSMVNAFSSLKPTNCYTTADKALQTANAAKCKVRALFQRLSLAMFDPP